VSSFGNESAIPTATATARALGRCRIVFIRSSPSEKISSAKLNTFCPASCQRQPARRPPEQLLPQRPLERLNLGADARLRHPQLFGGPRQPPLLGRHPEIPEVMIVQKFHAADHISFILITQSKNRIGLKGDSPAHCR
jgi:hypothetical protein